MLSAKLFAQHWNRTEKNEQAGSDLLMNQPGNATASKLAGRFGTRTKLKCR